MKGPVHREYLLTRRFTKNSEDYKDANRRITFSLVLQGKKAIPPSGPEKVVYVVRKKDEFLYIGETEKNITDRFESSFTNYRKYYHALSESKDGEKVKKRGNGGYKWIKWLVPDKPPSLRVDTFSFDSTTDREIIQAIEAEIVFMVRMHHKKWPIGQHEIHFFEENREFALGICKEHIFPVLNLPIDDLGR